MAERGVTDRVGVSQTNYGLFPIIAFLHIKTVIKPRLGVAIGGGLVGLAAFVTTNWSNSELAIRRSIEIRDENGRLEAEAKNMKIGSITVELHCYTKQSVLQSVKDFKENEVKRRLKEEFKKIGFDGELEVTLVNAEEVFQREEELRSLTDLEEGDKVTVGEVNVEPKKIEEDPPKSMEEKENSFQEKEKKLEGKERKLKEKEKKLEGKDRKLKEKEKQKEKEWEEKEKEWEEKEKKWEGKDRKLKEKEKQKEKEWEDKEDSLEEKERKLKEKEKRNYLAVLTDQRNIHYRHKVFQVPQ